jgi:succinoglycan biosynthesis transport protein ExoP
LQERPSEELQDASTPPKKSGLNLGLYLRAVRRNALVIIGSLGLTLGGAWFSSKQQPPNYVGSFQLLVEPVSSEARAVQPLALARGNGSTPDESAFRLDYTTQIAILTGPGMLSSIGEQVRAEDPGFDVGLLNKVLIERVGSDEYNPDQGTKILEVSFAGKNRENVQLVLEKVAEKYLRYSLEERKTRIREGVKFIEDQLPELQNRVSALRNEQQKLQERYELIDPNTKGEELFRQVRELTTQQVATSQQLQELKTLYGKLEQQLALTPDEAIAASALSENPNRTALLSQIKELDRQIAVERTRFTAENPVVRSLQRKRQNLVTLLEQETNQILGQNFTGTTENSQVLAFQNPVRLGLIQQLITTTNQIQVLEARQDSLSEAKGYYEQQAEQLPAVARQYSELQRQLDLTKQTLDQLLTQRETLRVEAAQSEVPWELLSQPFVPPMPIPGGEAKKLYILGFMGGLFLGLATTILLEKLRNRLHSAKDIKDVTGLPLLGEIPYERNIALQNNPLAPNLIANFNFAATNGHPIRLAESSLSESFDSLYANLRFLYADPPLRAIAIASAELGDGKSTVAIQLAQTIASTGRKVLLVDTNLRDPQLHAWLGLTNDRGLSELLSDPPVSEPAIQPVPFAHNLFLLPAGLPNPEAYKRLDSEIMVDWMERWQQDYDAVIYDTPNLLEFLDASFLSANADGLLLVSGVRKTRASHVNQMMQKIERYHLPAIGVVATHVKPGFWQKIANFRSLKPLPDRHLFLDDTEAVPQPEMSSHSLVRQEREISD